MGDKTGVCAHQKEYSPIKPEQLSEYTRPLLNTYWDYVKWVDKWIVVSNN